MTRVHGFYIECQAVNRGACTIGGRLIRGMCNRHYLQWRNQQFETPWWPARRPELDELTGEERRALFARALAPHLAKIDISDPTTCWEWRGARTSSGYGQLRVRGRAFIASRANYEANFGAIPSSVEVCHRCDNPPCVRPSHLFLGSLADNFADMRLKGRGVTPGPRYGEDHPGAIARDAQVVEARSLYATGAFTQVQLAERFHVTESTIGMWVRGEVRTEAGGPTTSVGLGQRHPNKPRAVCGVDGCAKPERCKGLCQPHYFRARRLRDAS